MEKSQERDAPRKVARGLYRLYKLTVSPLLGERCRFHPSCSGYALQAVERFGWLHGSWLAMKRFMKCHPFHPGGIDEVPCCKESKNKCQRSESYTHESR